MLNSCLFDDFRAVLPGGEGGLRITDVFCLTL